MKDFKKESCKCNGCKCESLSKAKEILGQKQKSVEGNKTIKKNFMPNGNIHFSV